MLVTCRHVIADGELLGIALSDGGRPTDFSVEWEDEDADLAVIRVEVDRVDYLRPSTGVAKAGDQLSVLSKFGSHAATVHERTEDGELVLSAPGLRKGASGGAVVDAEGKVIAVIVGALEGDAQRVVAVEPDWKTLLSNRVGE